MEAFSHFDFSLYNEIDSSKKKDLKHLLVKKKSIKFGALKTIKLFAYEETIFHHLPHGFLVCDNSKRQETQSRMA
nr:hypothetical protein [Prevotella sp.]